MKQENIRKIVFVTEKSSYKDEEDFISYLSENNATVLCSQKCDEGFVCLMHFEPGSVEVVAEIEP